MKLKLWRMERKPHYTSGFICYNGELLVHTLELPWLDNKRNDSCIPVGEYTCRLHDSPKFGETYHIQNVPDRSEIIFHAGNTILDTAGCILVGEQIKWVFNQVPRTRMVLESKKAMQSLMFTLGGRKYVDLKVENL